MILVLGLSSCAEQAGTSQRAEVPAQTLAIEPGGARTLSSDRLRALGPEGLVFALRDLDAAKKAGRSEPEIARLRRRVDEVAAQRDAEVSRLYWHTDIERAKDEAKRQKKSILSLRMLGRLDEEMSCANSRFFRTVLYPDPGVREILARRFVLHWSSERPVPVATIDFGDGHVLRRPVTGNSIHYVLDAQGRVVDAIPGLYEPTRFVHALEEASTLSARVGPLDDRAAQGILSSAHREAFQGGDRELRELAQRLGVDAKLTRDVPRTRFAARANTSALSAVPVAVAKAAVEVPVIESTMGRVSERSPDLWKAMAARSKSSVQLSRPARALMREKWENSRVALAGQKSRSAPGFEAVIAQFSTRLMEDSLKNEHDLHHSIHAWMMRKPGVSFEDLNRAVYSELFGTPRADPWVGMADPATYDAFDDRAVGNAGGK